MAAQAKYVVDLHVWFAVGTRLWKSRVGVVWMKRTTAREKKTEQRVRNWSADGIRISESAKKRRARDNDVRGGMTVGCTPNEIGFTVRARAESLSIASRAGVPSKLNHVWLA